MNDDGEAFREGAYHEEDTGATKKLVSGGEYERDVAEYWGEEFRRQSITEISSSSSCGIHVEYGDDSKELQLNSEALSKSIAVVTMTGAIEVKSPSIESKGCLNEKPLRLSLDSMECEDDPKQQDERVVMGKHSLQKEPLRVSLDNVEYEEHDRKSLVGSYSYESPKGSSCPRDIILEQRIQKLWNSAGPSHTDSSTSVYDCSQSLETVTQTLPQTEVMPPELVRSSIANWSRNGAYALHGPAHCTTRVERRATADAHALEPVVNEVNAASLDQLEMSEITRQSSQSRASFASALAKANVVDDAEPVVYAEDVQRDQFKRNTLRGAIFLSILFGAATVVIYLKVSGEAEKSGDPICWPSVEDQSVIVRCSCSNSTDGLYDDLSADEVAAYQAQLDKLQETVAHFIAVIGLTMDWNTSALPVGDIDVYSCDPFNQVLLTTTHELQKAWSVGMDALDHAPIDAVIGVGLLLMVYIFFDGIHWDQSRQWVDNPQVCEWFGVGCLSMDVIDELRLPNNGLSGTIPPILGLLTHLRVLDFSANNIWGTIPNELSFVLQLNTLSLSQLSLTGTIPESLTRLDRLGVLALNQNELTGTIPPELWKMPSLRELELASNRLNGTLPDSGYTENRISILRLHDNKLSGTIPEGVGNLSHLELLNLGRNNFSGTIPDFLGRMPRLEFINLYESGLMGTIPESFCDQNSFATKIVKIAVHCATTDECSCCSKDISVDALVILRCAEDDLPEFPLRN